MSDRPLAAAIDRLEAIAHEHGYEYTVQLDVATECAWGCEIRLTKVRERTEGGMALDNPQWSRVLSLAGGETSEQVGLFAIEHALRWLNEAEGA